MSHSLTLQTLGLHTHTLERNVYHSHTAVQYVQQTASALLCTHTHTLKKHTQRKLGQQGTVPVASLIKQWQLYYRPDKPDCAKGEKETEEKKDREGKGADREMEGAAG